MSRLAHKRGTWINQYAVPLPSVFTSRAKDVDYVIVKYGLTEIEHQAQAEGVVWLGERMAESGAGSQNGPANAATYGAQLANQANQPGAIGGVINLEEADGGWHLDDGTATRQLIETFRARAPGKELFASLDTRGNRPNAPYQRVCAELCDGVMPMVYPGAFMLPAPEAFAAALTPLLNLRWAGKDILPTYQTYTPPAVNVAREVEVLTYIYGAGKIQGANTYTMGHATVYEWQASLLFIPSVPQATPQPDDLAKALVALHAAWVAQWTAIAERGTPREALSLAQYWIRLTGG